MVANYLSPMAAEMNLPHAYVASSWDMYFEITEGPYDNDKEDDDLVALDLMVMRAADEPHDNVRLSWDNSNGEIRVYKDRKKIERIGNGEAFRWTGGRVHVEGVGLSSPGANGRPAPIVLVAEALDHHGQVIKMTPLAARRVEVLVGPILKRFEVEPKSVPHKRAQWGLHSGKPPTALFKARFTENSGINVGFVQTLEINNTLADPVGAREQKKGGGEDEHKYGYGKVSFLGQTNDYFGETLIDSEPSLQMPNPEVPFYNFDDDDYRKDEPQLLQASDTPVMGVAQAFRAAGRVTEISVKKQFDIFVVQKLGGTIYPLSKATWSVRYSGLIMGHGNNDWRFHNPGNGPGSVKSEVIGGEGEESHEKPETLVPPVVNIALNMTRPEEIDNGWRLA